MWKLIEVEDKDYIIRNDSTRDHHKLMLSDFVTLWCEEISSAALFERCKQLNPLMDTDQETLVSWMLSFLHNTSNAKINVKQSDYMKVLEINLKLAGVPFTLKFHLKELSSLEFYNELTLPLLLMVQQMQAQKVMLVDLLKKKDDEISQYKLEGAQLPHKSNEAGEFDQNQFEESWKRIEIPVQIAKRPKLWFTQEMQSLYVDVMKKHKDSRELVEADDGKGNNDDDDDATQSPQSGLSPGKRPRKSPEHWERLYATQNLASQTTCEDKIKVKKEEHQQNKQMLAKKKTTQNKRKLPL
ncbi:non-homologous end-joining factor 1-like isoform X2 [Periplaneta americana]|uniref:non-homologous end-joining factor 1-like isoform X2 n=1 Tax=Periplaneta americana TaxID=6978 RepID=UPI0037E7CC97